MSPSAHANLAFASPGATPAPTTHITPGQKAQSSGFSMNAVLEQQKQPRRGRASSMRLLKPGQPRFAWKELSS
eukprot:15477035-Alexandrium_andersonii.AAC.1